MPWPITLQYIDTTYLVCVVHINGAHSLISCLTNELLSQQFQIFGMWLLIHHTCAESKRPHRDFCSACRFCSLSTRMAHDRDNLQFIYNAVTFQQFLAYLLGLYFLHCRLSVQFNFIIRCVQAWIIIQPIRLLISNLTADWTVLVS